jgi:CHAT domain-containing protein
MNHIHDTSEIHNLREVFNFLSEETEPVPRHNVGSPAWMEFLEEQCSDGVWDTPIDEIEKTIQSLTETLDTAQDAGHLANTMTLEHLSGQLAQRYEIMGAMADLEKAIQCARQVIPMTPANSAGRSRRLSNLGTYLRLRYFARKLRSIHIKDVADAVTDLDEAVQLQTEAVELVQETHPRRADYESNLAMSLGERSEGTQSLISYREYWERKVERERLKPRIKNDLQRAIEIARRVSNTTSDNHASRGTFLYRLGRHLHTRYENEGGLVDHLRESIQITRQAVAHTPSKSPRQGVYLYELGCHLYHLFSKTKEVPHYHESMTCLDSALRHGNSSPSIRIAASKAMIFFCSDEKMACDAGNIAVSLFPKLVLPFHNDSDKQYALGRVFDLPSIAAAMALQVHKNPFIALHLLEQGHGALSKSVQDTRVDLRALEIAYPELAKRFTYLQTRLQSFNPNNSSSKYKNGWRQFNQIYKDSRDLDELIDEIRQKSGFELFLCLPSESEMRRAAIAGPIVVINTSRLRCDAIVVEEHRIQTVSLPNLSIDDIDEKEEILQDFRSPHTLQWLWNTIAFPVLDSLGFTEPPTSSNWPHIWWIPTGALHRFPLHAAGFHSNGTSNTVLDRVMSSYSSSIRTIIYARRFGPRLSMPAKALLVAMENTPGSSRLPFATDEITMLREKFQSMSLIPTEPPQYKEEVLSHLLDSTIFHFAGHGYTDLDDPSKTHLRLKDWESTPLTVNDLLKINLDANQPFLAYLSACGTGRVNEGRFMNESFHIISACQLAGFRHVIGTLWEVSDDLCVDMADIIYEGIRQWGMTDESVCRGLHDACRELRNRWLSKSQAPRRTGSLNTGRATSPSTGYACFPSQAHTGEDTAKVARDIGHEHIDEEAEGLDNPSHWIPYVHFGV